MLLRDLVATDADRKRSAINLAGKARIGEAVDRLIEVLTDEHETSNLRFCAALALGKIGDSAAVDALARTLKNADRELRDRSATALGGIDDPRVIDLLKQAQHDSDLDVVDAADRALLRRDQGNAIPESIRKFHVGTTSKDHLWDIACDLRDVTNGLDDHNAEIIADWCVSTLRGQDPVRFSAVCSNHILSTISQHSALRGKVPVFLRLLTVALKHHDYKIRGAAVEALGSILSRNQAVNDRDEILNKLISMLRDGVYDVWRRTVVELCEHIKDPRAIKPIEASSLAGVRRWGWTAAEAGHHRKWVLEQIKRIET